MASNNGERGGEEAEGASWWSVQTEEPEFFHPNSITNSLCVLEKACLSLGLSFPICKIKTMCWVPSNNSTHG